jgi:3-hydroxybutyryl-CoA dehydratase
MRFCPDQRHPRRGPDYRARRPALFAREYTNMNGFPVTVGDSTSFSKTIAESDVYLFAGITGDFAANHINEEYMRGSAYGHRVVHGALLIGFMSTTSTLMSSASAQGGEVPMSLGYDRIRFLAPVFIGDTVEVRYAIIAIDPIRRRATAKIEIVNQARELVAVAEHILKWVKR